MDAAQSRECPLCRRIAAGDLVRESADGLVVALLDAFPLAEGHTLVVPRRHKPDLFGLTADESAALWSLAIKLAREIKAENGADGLTIGVNAGAAPGRRSPMCTCTSCRAMWVTSRTRAEASAGCCRSAQRTGRVDEPRGGARPRRGRLRGAAHRAARRGHLHRDLQVRRAAGAAGRVPRGDDRQR